MTESSLQCCRQHTQLNWCYINSPAADTVNQGLLAAHTEPRGADSSGTPPENGPTATAGHVWTVEHTPNDESFKKTARKRTAQCRAGVEINTALPTMQWHTDHGHPQLDNLSADDKGYTLMAPDLVPIAISSSLGSKAKALGWWGNPCSTVWRQRKRRRLAHASLKHTLSCFLSDLIATEASKREDTLYKFWVKSLKSTDGSTNGPLSRSAGLVKWD